MTQDSDTALADRLLALLTERPSEETVSRINRALAQLDMSHDQTVRAVDVAAMLRAILVAVDGDGLHHSLRLQQSRFRLQRLNAAQSLERDDRLHGTAATMNIAFATALAHVPEKSRRVLFDGAAYLAANPDVRAAGIDPLEHFIAGGAAEGRRPGLNLDLDPMGMPQTVAALLTRTEPMFPDALPLALREQALASGASAGRRISVVIPTWNRARTLCDALDSALLQSLQPAEVIVADDGSTDGTIALLRDRYATRIASGQVQVLDLPHRGVSAARNAALQAASGDIIAYLDSDNMWEADHLLYATLGLREGAASAYTALNRHNLSDGWSDVLFRPYDRSALEHENYIDLNVFVHTRDLTDRLGGFDPRLTRLVDWDLILRLTTDAAPQPVAVITAHHVIDARRLRNISVVEEFGPNNARVLARLEQAK